MKTTDANNNSAPDINARAFAFAIRIVKLYKWLCADKKEYVMSKQLLRSGTSIGANICEARYGQSRRVIAD